MGFSRAGTYDLQVASSKGSQDSMLTDSGSRGGTLTNLQQGNCQPFRKRDQISSSSHGKKLQRYARCNEEGSARNFLPVLMVHGAYHSANYAQLFLPVCCMVCPVNFNGLPTHHMKPVVALSKQCSSTIRTLSCIRKSTLRS